MVVLGAIVAGSPSGIASVHASSERGEDWAPEVPLAPQQQESEDRDPEANLPYLFAVFFITWAAFFGYVFVMSRRQREMQGEIDALKRALADRAGETIQSEPPSEARGA